MNRNSRDMGSIRNLEAYPAGMSHYPENIGGKTLTTMAQVHMILSAGSLSRNSTVAEVKLCISAAHSVDSMSPPRKMSG